MRRITLSSSLMTSMFILACGGIPATGGEVIGVGGSGFPLDTGGAGFDVGGSNWGGETSVGVGGATLPTETGGSAGSEGGSANVGGTNPGETGGTGVFVSDCGNSVVEANENCDDGNATPGDGCSGVCRTEPNYICEVPGQPCVSTVVCGDGAVTGNEACDDHNTTPNDGCAADCKSIDPGYTCPTPGQLCEIGTGPAVCGNGSVDANETCDDNNTEPNDGCSATCKLEFGYTCPTPGKPCVPNQYCGDGAVNGEEQCDDGNRKPGDCCDGNCHLEPYCSCSTPNPPLVPPHQVCVSTIVCGNGSREGTEACDDNNTGSNDGCSADCTTVEPGYNCPREGGTCTAVPSQVCGNGILEAGEYCDDGNSYPADGCTDICEVQSGYTCSVPGQLCTAIPRCGDGIVNFVRGETCDDGNTDPADGCGTTCTIDLGWSCDNSGQSQVPPVASVCANTTVCGDKKITGAETCDDGNKTPKDGCSDTCKVEQGWVCPIVGTACRAAACGDKIIAGTETCEDDDTTPTSNDGCSSTCQREDGWACPTPGAACHATKCGDGNKEGSEQCDIGDVIPYDGCSPTCTNESVCSSGTCSNACGDGLKFPQEECDDGNTRSGDGCSSDCKTENGWICETVTQPPLAKLTIPLLVRDFMASNTPSTGAPAAGHVDFEQGAPNNDYYCEAPGLLATQLGTDGKPTFASSNGTKRTCIGGTTGNVIANATSFGSWYHNSAYNTIVSTSLTLVKKDDGSYVFDSATDEPYKTLKGFFPINGKGWQTTTACAPCQTSNPPSWCGQCPPGDTKTKGNNFHFTSELRYQFTYGGGEVLNFTGDDDVWVYINGKLVVDLGGVHDIKPGSVTLDAATVTSLGLGLVKGGMYEIALFQAERHTTVSNYKLTLNGFVHATSQCKSVCPNGIVTPDEACDLGVGKNTGEYGGCNPDCTLAPNCGDHLTQTDIPIPEECDDGVNVTLYDNTKQACGPSCRRPHFCGDPNLDSAFGELCDNGTANSDTAYGPGECDTKCRPAPYCGDESRQSNEECDDGAANGTPASLCDTSCHLKCGNGAPDPGEQCDRGAANNVGGYNGCNANCTLGAYCGDGFKQGSEQCDDGKNDGSYGTCMPGCLLAGYCGDGTPQNPPELCDQGSYNSLTAYGIALCTDQCEPAPYCGDKAVNGQFGEKCDDGVNSGQPGSCMQDCKGWVPLLTCGDNNIDYGEECDDGARNGGSESNCDIHCRIHCGNGVVDANETCDNGVNDGSYGGCTWNCEYADFCGDGIKNGPEQCDLGTRNDANAYGKGTCTTSCKQGGYCGDGRVQSPTEACDGQPSCTSACQWWVTGG